MPRAAVLVLLGPRDGQPTRPPASLKNLDPAETSVLLIKRSLALRMAAGQIAFPGGMLDPGEDPITAAIREAEEETGVDPSGIEVLRELTPGQMGYGQVDVHPVLAWWTSPGPVRPVDAAETSDVFVAAVADLLNPAHRFTAVYGGLVGRIGHRGPAWLLDLDGSERLIWGFTGRVLNDVFDDLGWTLPWDRNNEMQLNSAGTAPA